MKNWYSSLMKTNKDRTGQKKEINILHKCLSGNSQRSFSMQIFELFQEIYNFQLNEKNNNKTIKQRKGIAGQ